MEIWTFKAWKGTSLLVKAVYKEWNTMLKVWKAAHLSHKSHAYTQRLQRNAPATFQREVQTVLADFPKRNIIIYFDAVEMLTASVAI